jgi:5-methylcytosine-specific restriction enzyme A
MNRRQFVESEGATCANWSWSWSFINTAKREIIFGAWDKYTEPKRVMILSDEWITNDDGRRSPGYPQSLEHIRLIRDEGYQLLTFPMRQRILPNGKVKIGGITRLLSPRKLTSDGGKWWAYDLDVEPVPPLPEELPGQREHVEGRKITVKINAYERSPEARAECIAHHGYKCAVCGFDFTDKYGDLGKNFIHVHHLIPIGQIGREYRVNGVRDLRPVCPNCHAMLHRPRTMLTIEELRRVLRR